MSDYAETLQKLVADLRIGISLCTRLPVGPASRSAKATSRARAGRSRSRDLLVGLAGALVYWLAVRVNVAPQPAAALALAATLLLTGAMHEDGLADTADGLGGGDPRAQARDHARQPDRHLRRLRAAISLMLRWSALADIAEPRVVALALICAHVSARACVPAFMYLVPPARADGLSSGAGQPPFASVVTALLLGIVALLLAFGPTGAMVTLLLLLLVALVLARLAIRQFGGQTGDVLGALEQIGEAPVLLVSASLF